MLRLFIPGNTASSKNSKQAVRNKKTGKQMFIWSKTAQKYRKNSAEYYKCLAASFNEEYEKYEKPVVVGFHFIRDTKRKFDYPNPLQTVLDLMVANEWISDDNMECIVPEFIKNGDSYWTVNKEMAGVEIVIDPSKNELKSE